MKHTYISSKITSQGFQTIIDKKTIQTTYPRNVWSSMPKAVQEKMAQTASYFVTRHLPVSSQMHLIYEFAPPEAKLFVDYGFFYSMTEEPFEFPEKNLTTNEVLKSVYNSEFFVKFNKVVPLIKEGSSPEIEKGKIIMPISFGKDSLTTFALCRELGLKPTPFFFKEPACEFQNIKKEKLREEFQKEFGVQITTFSNKLGDLRQPSGMMWGWDMLLLHYTILLLPYAWYQRPEYFLWSNEQSTNEFEKDKEGYIINSTHEQSVQWTLSLTNLFRIFGLNTTVSSLLEPVHELLILSILHKRYPNIGKYQLSCDEEKTKFRWCGSCFECARIFLFLTALGIDPKSVGLMDNMFAHTKRDLFYLFSQKKQSLDILFQSYPERLLAFYVAYKRGIKGTLMEEFASKLLPSVEKQKKQLFAKYYTVHESLTIPLSIKAPLYKIYNEELQRLKREIA